MLFSCVHILYSDQIYPLIFLNPLFLLKTVLSRFHYAIFIHKYSYKHTYKYCVYIYKMYFERVMGMYMLILVLFHISYFSGLSIKMTL
jgi:hypothetical protein